MSIYTQPNLTAGMDDAFVDVAQTVPTFPIMILVFMFAIVLAGGSANQKRRLGYADYPFWTVLASTTTTFIALIMTLGDGMIDVTTLGIVVGINILSAIWYFFSKVRGEQ